MTSVGGTPRSIKASRTVTAREREKVSGTGRELLAPSTVPFELASLLEPEPPELPPVSLPILLVPVAVMAFVGAIILLGWSPLFLVPIAGSVSAALVVYFRREAFQRRMSSLFAHLAAGSALVPTVSLVVEDSRLLLSGAGALVTISLVAASCVFGWQEHRQFMGKAAVGDRDP